MYRKLFVFIAAIVTGILFGLWFYPYTGYVAWMGDIFLLSLTILLIPIVLFSIIVAIIKPNKDELIHKGFKTIGFYVATTLLAVLTGLGFVTAFHAGAGMKSGVEDNMERNISNESEDSSLNNIVSNNIQGDKNAELNAQNEQKHSSSKEKSQKTILAKIRETLNKAVEGVMFYVIIIALLSGLLIHYIPKSIAQPVKRFSQLCFNRIMSLMSWIANYIAPFGIFALIAGKCAQFHGSFEEMGATINSLGMFVLTNFLGMSFHFFIILSLLLIVFARINPIHHIANVFPSILTAFSTASSNAAMPKSLECLENNSTVSPQTAEFVMPLGSIFNMNGTALFACVTVISVYQMNNTLLSISDYALIVTATMLASVGLSVMPMAGYFIAAIVLNIRIEDLSFLLIVDTILEMTRAALNIYGNSCCAVCIARLEGETLKG